MEFTKPKMSFNEIEIPVYNSRVYLAGKPEWETVTCMLRDDASGEVSKRVGEQMQKQFDFMEQASAAAGIDYKFVTKFETLDGGNGASEPVVLDTWELYGTYISNVDYSDGDYSVNDPMTINLTLRYVNAIQTPIGTGLGTAVKIALGTVVTG